MKETDCAYMAGMIDGEGCIHISKRKPRPKNGQNFSWSYRAELIIAQNSRGMLEKLQTIWQGGTIHKNKRFAHQLRFGAADTYRILEACAPYMLLKADQAALMLEFRETFKGQTKSGRSLAESTLEARERLFIAMTKRHGTFKSKAASRAP